MSTGGGERPKRREGGKHQHSRSWQEGPSEDLKYGQLWTRAVWHPRARTTAHTHSCRHTLAPDGLSGIKVRTEPRTDQAHLTSELLCNSEQPLHPAALSCLFMFVCFQTASSGNLSVTRSDFCCLFSGKGASSLPSSESRAQFNSSSPAGDYTE